MRVPQPTTDWTVDMLEMLPDDGRRYEIIDGELLVTPAPYVVHQIVVGELYALLREYLRAHPVGRAIVAPADVRSGDRTSVAPDVFVIPQAKGPFPRIWAPLGARLLAVEVLSATTARADRGRKRALYQREGVAEYWIVDVDARLIEVRPNDPATVGGSAGLILVVAALASYLPARRAGRIDPVTALKAE